MKKLNFFAALCCAAAVFAACEKDEATTGSSDVLTDAFSVSEDKQVRFSRGNLQCSGVKSGDYKWSFAEHQYDMLGDANLIDGALADKIDLFCWSGSTGSAKWGIGTSDTAYSGDFVDWGRIFGTGTTYRTLTNDEWEYLLNWRANADDKNGVARIKLSETEYANGLILLPDSWTCPADVEFESGFASSDSIEAYATHQTFTIAQWQKLEAAGAIFLPASGLRFGDVRSVQYYGRYWSATPGDPYDVDCLIFYSNEAFTDGGGIRNFGQAVRLVQDLD